jgi:hypothetical protein
MRARWSLSGRTGEAGVGAGEAVGTSVGAGRCTVSACFPPHAQSSAQQSSRENMLVIYFFMGILLVIDVLCGYDVILCRNVSEMNLFPGFSVWVSIITCSLQKASTRSKAIPALFSALLARLVSFYRIVRTVPVFHQ